MFACQAVYKGKRLPRLVIDAELLHDAMGDYCEHFNINERDLDETPGGFGDGYWVEHQETYEEDYDLPAVRW